MTANITHEFYCTPRPGETEPRIESYRVDQTAEDGITVINRPMMHRCVECAAFELVGALPTVARTATRTAG